MASNESKTFCQNCLQYIESSKFILHERMCSINVKKCPKCEKPYNLDDLDDHIKFEHSFLSCDLCGNKFIAKELEGHKINCDFRLIPCKYCELNVIFQEIEEHENICGSTTKQCEKCGLVFEKKIFNNHICQKKENEYLNEYIKIDKIYKDKEEKKKAKNKNNKKNKSQNIKNENENKINNPNYYEDNSNLDMIFSSKEMYYQIKALKKFEDKKNNELINKKEEEDTKEKKNKKNKKKKGKVKEKEDEKEENNKNNNKKKKGKKNKNSQNNNNKNFEDYSDDEDDDYFPTKKKANLHNIKFDLPPEEYENYNKVKNVYNNKYNDFISEENMILEAIKKSLVDK